MSFQGIFLMFISTIVFTLILNKLKRSNPKIFLVLNKIPTNWKGKWYIRWFFIILLFIISAPIVVYWGMNDMAGFIIAGFIVSLCDFAFKKPQGEQNEKF